MPTIDLIVLGIVKKEPLSAYDIQKLVEYRNISRWVKISTPSIYKKVIQLEQKGFIRGTMIKEGNMAEKAVYSLTEEGEEEFRRLMFGISSEPVHMFLDFNAVIVNLDSLSAVSYTHLVIALSGTLGVPFSWLRLSVIGALQYEPVSYTHLDVYKRQMWGL